MAFLKRGPAAGLVAADPQSLGTISLGAPYGVVKGFNARNYASSAKAAAGTDTAQKVQLTDANGVVFYLDAADKDYATAAIDRVIAGTDDTVTGLGVISTDATGATATAGASGDFVAKSPVTVVVDNGTTATDYFEIYLNVLV